MYYFINICYIQSKLKEENEKLKKQLQFLSQSSLKENISSTSGIRDHYSVCNNKMNCI